MSRCPFCGQESSSGSRFCPSCGKELELFSEAPTEMAGSGSSPGQSGRMRSARVGASATASMTSSDTLEEVRFLPGTVLADRYRIIGLLGRGGMGEVYQADDLTLGQPVALKILPESLEGDKGRLERLLSEVRTARRVAHANVCRVYDIGQVDGQHFFSMEYVDGEDLKSLLRRIGRLPGDKAVEIARQLCAGLAAAHDQGILHRDLKPANVMIDGRGRVRITDFGLAGLATDFQGIEIRSGTPAYMAPEQLAGKDVSVKSDIYALGLVLYELFTGRPPFKADSAAELVRMQQSSAPTTPSSHASDIDTAVERVILRCLEKEPADRPASALAVAAALPGGDPLAAALAAGETPTPEMVAAAGSAEGMSRWLAVTCLAVVLVGLVAFVLSDSRHMVVSHVPLPMPPQALEVEAQRIAGDLGYTEPPQDSVGGFVYDNDYLTHVREQDSPDRWDNLATVQPPAVIFWYRQSPRNLVPQNFVGVVALDDPPLRISGEISMTFHPAGRLLAFQAVPPQHDPLTPEPEAGQQESSADPSRAPAPPDWDVLFAAAGLESESFTTVPPEWNPLVSCDTRAAWTGLYAGQPDVPIRVEACAYRGRTAYFEVIAPWETPSRQQSAPVPAAISVLIGIFLTLIFTILTFALILARRNLRLGRGDRTGAFRIAIYVLGVAMLGWLLRTDHVPGLAEVGLLLNGFGRATINASLAWLFYMALEPYVRKLWPHVLITWRRLLAGRLEDPLVGRDVLVGAAGGVLLLLQTQAVAALERSLGVLGTLPGASFPLFGLVSMRKALGMWTQPFLSSLITSMGLLFLFLLLRVVLRKQWFAIGGMFVLFMAPVFLVPETSWVVRVGAPFVLALMLFVLLRFGILALAVVFLFNEIETMVPVTSDLGAWQVSQGLIGPVLVLAIAAYAFYLAMAGKSLLGGGLLED